MVLMTQLPEPSLRKYCPAAVGAPPRPVPPCDGDQTPVNVEGSKVPGGPWRPCGPCCPCGPGGPCGPCPPCNPISPMRPGGPCGPVLATVISRNAGWLVTGFEVLSICKAVEGADAAAAISTP